MLASSYLVRQDRARYITQNLETIIWLFPINVIKYIYTETVTCHISNRYIGTSGNSKVNYFTVLWPMVTLYPSLDHHHVLANALYRKFRPLRAQTRCYKRTGHWPNINFRIIDYYLSGGKSSNTLKINENWCQHLDCKKIEYIDNE